MEKVATGEHWFGTTALELGLIDKVSTSDDLILDAVKSRDVYKIEVESKTSLFEKVTNKVTALLYSWNVRQNSSFYTLIDLRFWQLIG